MLGGFPQYCSSGAITPSVTPTTTIPDREARKERGLVDMLVTPGRQRFQSAGFYPQSAAGGRTETGYLAPLCP
jgi:hypothetical protein